MAGLSKFRLLALALLGCLGAALSTPTAAQTISQPIDNGGSGNQPFTGQSFTATVTGTITQIRISPAGTTNGATLYFYNGTGTGAFNAAGTPIYTQAGINLPALFPGNLQTITLTTPVPVTAGTVYSFAFDNSNLRVGFSNPVGPYTSGVAFTNGTTQQANVDLAFEVVQVATPVPVPTLSEWAMILFGLMLAGGAALYIQQRQLAD
jgi:hypothetical protein